ncbi:unnamed protein product [Dicrocoelium dendriticum]|nr:unnamed protein product [Dicrocoelium dendriticum]
MSYCATPREWSSSIAFSRLNFALVICSTFGSHARDFAVVAKVIYRAYIKSGALFEVPLPERVRAEIITRMALYHTGYKVRYTVSLGPINRSLYDSAGEYVKTTLEQVYYPAFQKFITDAHFLLGCPKEDSSSPDLSRAPSTYASSALHVPANFSADIQAPIRELKAEVNPLRHCFTDCTLIVRLPRLYASLWTLLHELTSSNEVRLR